jgi:DNA modification methylase
MSVRVLTGDCRQVLASLPAASVNCIVTSPPYYGLRDYGVDGQIGLEQTPDAYVSEMVAVFREARRVLRDDGTLWLNIGDSYNNFRSQMGPGQTVHGREKMNGKPMEKSRRRGWNELKEKDLIGIPWMLAFALRADGWYLRQDIIWSKPNPMPESVRDRCTKAHEYVFLLSKRERYFFDAEAISEPGVVPAGTKAAKGGAERFNIPGVNSRPPEYKVYSGRRNRRSVWTIATEPSGIAHFAMMPTALAELCIMAGCPAGGTVLDPFGGAGTTGLVADRLGRNAILIELNPANTSIAADRLRGDAGMFAMVAAE